MGTGTGATGSLLVALTGGQMAIITTFATLARRYPRMVPWGHLAFVIGAIGLGLLATVPTRDRPHDPHLRRSHRGLVFVGAGPGLSLQSYTLLGQAVAPTAAFGAAMGLLTFGRQLGGSLGAAAFGCILLATNDPAVGPSLVLTGAAVVVAALLAAPRSADETSSSASG